MVCREHIDSPCSSINPTVPTLLAKSVGASNSSGFVASQRNTLPTWDVTLSKVCFTHLEYCTSSPFSSSSKSAVWLKPGFHQTLRTPMTYLCAGYDEQWWIIKETYHAYVQTAFGFAKCLGLVIGIARLYEGQGFIRLNVKPNVIFFLCAGSDERIVEHSMSPSKSTYKLRLDSQNVYELLWLMLGCMKARVSSGSTYASMRNSTCVQDMTRAMVHFQCNLSSPCTNCV